MTPKRKYTIVATGPVTFSPGFGRLWIDSPTGCIISVAGVRWHDIPKLNPPKEHGLGLTADGVSLACRSELHSTDFEVVNV